MTNDDATEQTPQNSTQLQCFAQGEWRVAENQKHPIFHYGVFSEVHELVDQADNKPEQ